MKSPNGVIIQEIDESEMETVEEELRGDGEMREVGRRLPMRRQTLYRFDLP